VDAGAGQLREGLGSAFQLWCPRHSALLVTASGGKPEVVTTETELLSMATLRFTAVSQHRRMLPRAGLHAIRFPTGSIPSWRLDMWRQATNNIMAR
jgi:hypothetical protein